MARSTVDFGIDLGTTNSAIAVATENGVVVIKNNDSADYTPSAVWIDKGSRLYVGRAARQHLDDDPENAAAEFKLKMGFDYVKHFAASGRTMKPEELSAEVLKSLRSDVLQHLHEEITSAVITIPAAFDINQRDATQRAAGLAGLTNCPLLQEPVAAALAYTFRHDDERGYWLVYDFGGGTFDAAVIQLEDGAISVINHSGDSDLGGKLIDWAIVEDLFIPAVVRQWGLSDFRRGNPTWRAAIAKLKQDAENVKIRLSREESALVTREFLCLDDTRQPVGFEFEVHRADVERLAEPFIVRTIHTCQKALGEKSLRASNIEKVILVGGPTLMPYLRERLESHARGLGIPLEFRIDPLTVVAQGAALFASTQRMQVDAARLQASRDAGIFTISFPGWSFKGSDLKPLVAGIVAAPLGQTVQGSTVQFVNENVQPPWRSGQIAVTENGTFTAELYAIADRANTFRVVLRDSTGRQQRVATTPETLSYTKGAIIDHTLLTHSIGVGLRGNLVEWFLEKGTPLPARERRSLRSPYEVSPAIPGSVIRIPVVEGESSRADRNHRVGTIEITAAQLRRIVPIGTEVDVTIEADTSGLVRMTAYIGLLGDEFQHILHFGGAESEPDLAGLREDLQRQLERIEALRGVDDAQVNEILRQIDDEQIVRQVQVEIAAAQDDPGLAPAAQKRLMALMTALDKADDSADWPYLVTDAENYLANARDLARRTTGINAAANLHRLEGEIKAAIQAHDSETLRQRTRVLNNLMNRMLDQAGILPQKNFEWLESHLDQLTNPGRAAALIQEGRDALALGDYPHLREVNALLYGLLPPEVPPPDEGTLIRGGR